MPRLGMYAALLVALCAGPIHADVWDVQGDNDDSDRHRQRAGARYAPDSTTWACGPDRSPTGLVPDAEKPYASYEVIVDGVSGDLGVEVLEFERIVLDPGHIDPERGAPWWRTPAGTRVPCGGRTPTNLIAVEFVRVSGGICGTACGVDDVYTIRARETTVSLSRFNAVGSQATVLLTQNVSERPVNVTYYLLERVRCAPARRCPSPTIRRRRWTSLNVGTVPGLCRAERPRDGRSRRRVRRAEHQGRRPGAVDRLQLRHARRRASPTDDTPFDGRRGLPRRPFVFRPQSIVTFRARLPSSFAAPAGAPSARAATGRA